jgi:hypothetical protein
MFGVAASSGVTAAHIIRSDAPALAFLVQIVEDKRQFGRQFIRLFRRVCLNGRSASAPA